LTGRDRGRGHQNEEPKGVRATRPQDTWHDTPVAQPKQRNIVERLADVGEEAIQRIGTVPGADRLVASVNSTRERLDDVQKRLRGVEQLEQRLAAVERRLDKLEGKGKSTSRKTSSASPKPSSSSSS
jgi:hypothetical protein